MIEIRIVNEENTFIKVSRLRISSVVLTKFHLPPVAKN